MTDMLNGPGERPVAGPPGFGRAALACACLGLLGACAGPHTGTPPAGWRPRVAATTSVIGDVVSNVGGGLVDLSVLMPLGADPHSFTPTSRQMRAVAEADLLLVNGLGLEAGILTKLQGALQGGRMVALSEASGVPTPVSSAPGTTIQGAAEIDPHVWMDPIYVVAWTRVIESALTQIDPGHGAAYAANAAAYRQRLDRLDASIRDLVAQLPEDRRLLVTDHRELGYFASRYRFRLVDSVLPGVSTLAEPSAAGMAKVRDEIANLGVPAIFVGVGSPAPAAEQVAADAGVRLVRLYAASLSPPGGPASTYEDMMRYDAAAIVKALSSP
jgi:ABC-type Zn uptake system ZnuABC Zn-binding protein ZnuA